MSLPPLDPSVCCVPRPWAMCYERLSDSSEALEAIRMVPPEDVVKAVAPRPARTKRKRVWVDRVWERGARYEEGAIHVVRGAAFSGTTEWTLGVSEGTLPAPYESWCARDLYADRGTLLAFGQGGFEPAQPLRCCLVGRDGIVFDLDVVDIEAMFPLLASDDLRWSPELWATHAALAVTLKDLNPGRDRMREGAYGDDIDPALAVAFEMHAATLRRRAQAAPELRRGQLEDSAARDGARVLPFHAPTPRRGR